MRRIRASVERVESLDVLINNAGVALYDDLGDRAAIEQSLAVNFYGTYGMTQAFLPLLTGPVDTEMSRDLDVPKASAESVARGILDGVEKGEDDIFPDPMSESLAESWRSSAAKALERQFAVLVAQPANS